MGLPNTPWGSQAQPGAPKHSLGLPSTTWGSQTHPGAPPDLPSFQHSPRPKVSVFGRKMPQSPSLSCMSEGSTRTSLAHLRLRAEFWFAWALVLAWQQLQGDFWAVASSLITLQVHPEPCLHLQPLSPPAGAFGGLLAGLGQSRAPLGHRDMVPALLSLHTSPCHRLQMSPGDFWTGAWAPEPTRFHGANYSLSEMLTSPSAHGTECALLPAKAGDKKVQ